MRRRCARGGEDAQEDARCKFFNLPKARAWAEDARVLCTFLLLVARECIRGSKFNHDGTIPARRERSADCADDRRLNAM
jgi:hypothetical protein